MDQELRLLYVSSLLQQAGRISLPIGSTSERLQLDAVFQPLTLRQGPLAAEDLTREQRRPLLGEEDDKREKREDAEDEHMTVPSIHEALRHSRTGRMVVLGGPGTGKTTVLKSLITAACRDVETSETAPLPIFISLPDLARSGSPDLRDYLPLVVEQLGLPAESASQLTDEVTSGKALVGMDSLDEVAPNLRAGVIEWIVREAPRWGGHWVIGSRFTSYKGGELGALSFSEWELTPLDESLRLELARRLLPVLRVSLGTPPVDRDDDARALVAEVAAHPETKAWGENPLLLSLAAVAHVKHGGLPASRAALYAEVIAAVLMTREPDTGRQAGLLRALGRISLTLFQQKGRTFTRRDLDTVVASLSVPAPEGLATRALDSGILEVVAREVYAFRHQTLQEYLAATALANDLTSGDERAAGEAWELMWSKRTYSRWTEVLRLVVGVLVRRRGRPGAEQARRWLAALAAQAASGAGDPGNLGLALAVRSAVEVADAPAEWAAVEGVEAAAMLVRSWAAGYLVQNTSGYIHLRKLRNEIRQLDPRAIAAGMDATLAVLTQDDPRLRWQALEALACVADFLPPEPLVAYWQRLQEMPRDDYWSHEADSAVELIGKTGQRAPVDLLLGATGVEFPAAYRALVICASEGNEEALAACRRLLSEDPDVRVRRSLATSIVQLASSERLGEWALSGLDDPDAGVRRLSVDAWQRLSQRYGEVRGTTHRLLRVLQDGDGSVRAEAAQALGYVHATEATGALITLLRDDFETARQKAANALGELRAREALGPLVACLQAPSETARVRAQITAALVKVDPAASVPYVLALLKGGDTAQPDNALLSASVALISLGRLIPTGELVELAAHPVPQVRTAVAQVLARFGAAAPREILVNLLTDENSDVRRTAANAAGASGDATLVSYLRRMLADPDWNVRGQAAHALTQLGEPGATVSVADLLADFSVCDDQTIASAITIVGEMKDGAPLDLLREALQQRSLKICQATMKTLRKIGSNEAAVLMISAMRDDNPEVRRAAISGLSDVPPELLPVSELIQFMRTDTDPNVRAAAAGALQHAGAAAPAADLADALARDADAKVRVAAAQALAILGSRAPFDSLVTALDDSNLNVCAAAAHALSSFGDRVPVEKLFTALKRPGSTYLQQVRFINALGAASNRIPIERFLEVLDDRACFWRPAAIVALGYYGDQAPVDRLIELLTDSSRRPGSDSNTQTAATSALLRLGNRVPTELMLSFLVNVNFISRNYAAKALVDLGADAPVDRIRELLDNKDPDIRYWVLSCLCRMEELAPDEVFVAALDDPAASVRELAATAVRTRKLAWARPQVEAAWRRATADGFDVRVALAHALISLGGSDDGADSDIPELLLQALVEDDETSTSGVGAAAALIDLGDQAPAASLLPYLGSEDEDLIWRVASVLRATHPQALRQVLPEISAIVRERRAGTIVGSRMRTATARAISRMQRVPPVLLTLESDLLDWPFPSVRRVAAHALGTIRRDIPDTTIRKLLAMRDGPDRIVADDALANILSLETGIEDD